MSDEPNQFLFVYGTLKSGQPSHFMLVGAEFLGPARTVGRFALRVDELPRLIRDEAVSRIRGELYRVGLELLGRLDDFEGHPGLYQREWVEVEVEDPGGKQVQAWAYFSNETRGRLMESGEFG